MFNSSKIQKIIVDRKNFEKVLSVKEKNAFLAFVSAWDKFFGNHRSKDKFAPKPKKYEYKQIITDKLMKKDYGLFSNNYSYLNSDL